MMLNKLFDSIEKQPRVMQWAIYAVAFLAAFMVWSSVIEPLRQEWADEVATIEANISEVRAASDLARDFGKHKDTIVSLGKVDVPETRRAATVKINEAVAAILDRHRSKINEDSFELTSGRMLDKRDTARLLGGSITGERLNGKLEFEADRLVVSEIIAELEANEHIEAVRSVRLTHLGRDNVRALIEFEAWVIAENSNRRS